VTTIAEAPPDFTRTPPHDIAAEQSVLGGMMLSADSINDVLAARIKSPDFYRPGHQLIFEAIVVLHEANKAADPVAVANYLTVHGNIGRMGGAPYLHTCIATVPTAANAGYYARIVVGRAILRELIEVGTRAVQAGYSYDLTDIGEPEEIVERMLGDMEAILSRAGRDVDIEPMNDLMLRILGELSNPAEHQKLRLGTGFIDLDALLSGGVEGGEMIVIAGRPSSGKSTVAIDISRHLSIDPDEEDRVAGLILSLEMSRDQLALRMLSAQARVNHMRLQEPEFLERDDWDRINKVFPQMRDAPVYIDDSPLSSIRDIYRKVKDLLRAGIKIGYIVIDYLQLISSPQGGRQPENRQQEVSGFSRAIKLLAKLLKIPIFVCAQLNRGPDQRADHRPILSDLRESGSVEQDADHAWLLYREDMYERESPRAGEADFIVAKHRRGPTSTVTVAFQGHYCRFVDMAT
jgi:replicative DNA helicase